MNMQELLRVRTNSYRAPAEKPSHEELELMVNMFVLQGGRIEKLPDVEIVTRGPHVPPKYDEMGMTERERHVLQAVDSNPDIDSLERLSEAVGSCTKFIRNTLIKFRPEDQRTLRLIERGRYMKEVHTQFAQERIDKIEALRAKGIINREEIAENLGISQKALYNFLYRNDLLHL